MPFSEPPPQPPKQDVPLVGTDGKINPDWHRFILLLLEYLKRMGASIT